METSKKVRQAQLMKLRLGQPVHSTDGLFGELGDIVVDPVALKVTHVVVEPREQHSQARLVPIWLVTNEDDSDILKVALSAPYLRQLQRVAFEDFVSLGGTITVDDKWDIGTQDVIASPYWDVEGLVAPNMTHVSYDRIPKGECEIRRRSEVTTADYHIVGHVEGLVADKDDLVAVVVLSGMPGRRSHVVVPMSSVASVFNDEILLAISRSDFAALPRTEGLSPSEQPRGHRLENIRAGTSRLARRALHRRHRTERGDQR